MNMGQETQYQNLWAQAGAMNNGGANQGMGQAGYDQAQGNLANQGQMLGNAGYYNQMGMNALGGQGMQQANSTLTRMQNPGMDPMMGVYSRQIGQNFNEQVMPGLRGDAMAAGGLGGSRAGIAQGLAGARAGQQLQDFGAQLYGQNQDRALNAANMQGALQGNIAQGYGQGAAMAGQIGQGYGQMGTQALANAQFGMGIPWYNLQQYAGLLGGPVMEDLGGTGQTTGSSSGRGSNFNAHIW
jgi:hypothetical protein